MPDTFTLTRLDLAHLAPQPDLAHWLDSATARRFHALPIARDQGRITVALAEPTDLAARAAVERAMQTAAIARQEPAPEIVWVQGDTAQIDAWLLKLAFTVEPPITALTIQLDTTTHPAVARYAEQVAHLLTARLAVSTSSETASNTDTLLIRTWPPENDTVRIAGEDDLGPALLYACQPRWPLRRVLLIGRGDPVDDAALTWAARVIHASGAATTALMVAPHAAAVSALPAQDDIASLLSPHHALGFQMQRVAQQLAALQLDAVLHLRQGAPATVIREELACTPYDLAIAGVAIRGASAQWRLRPLLGGLLPDFPCPLLLTSG